MQWKHDIRVRSTAQVQAILSRCICPDRSPVYLLDCLCHRAIPPCLLLNFLHKVWPHPPGCNCCTVPIPILLRSTSFPAFPRLCTAGRSFRPTSSKCRLHADLHGLRSNFQQAICRVACPVPTFIAFTQVRAIVLVYGECNLVAPILRTHRFRRDANAMRLPLHG